MSGTGGYSLDTIGLHAGQTSHETTKPDPGFVEAPLYLSCGRVFSTVDEAAACFALARTEFGDPMFANPTVAVLEQRLAALEGGIGCIAAASGQAALFLAISTLLQAGDRILASETLCADHQHLLRHTLARFGIETTFIDLNSPQARDAVPMTRTRLVVAETLGNPSTRVLDLPKVADWAHDRGLPLLVDASLTTPYCLQTCRHGADLVLHATPGFLCGNDGVFGALIVDSGKFDWSARHNGVPLFPTLVERVPDNLRIAFTDLSPFTAFLEHARHYELRDFGSILAPFNALQILNGIPSLSLRMARRLETAMSVATFLAGHEAVERVMHPTRPDHPDHGLSTHLYPKGSSALISVRLKKGEHAARIFIERLRLFRHTAQTGGDRSSVIHPASTTHARMPPDALVRCGADSGSVRLTIGLEEADDLIADLSRALKTV